MPTPINPCVSQVLCSAFSLSLGPYDEHTQVDATSITVFTRTSITVFTRDHGPDSPGETVRQRGESDGGVLATNMQALCVVYGQAPLIVCRGRQRP